MSTLLNDNDYERRLQQADVRAWQATDVQRNTAQQNHTTDTQHQCTALPQPACPLALPFFPTAAVCAAAVYVELTGVPQIT